MKKKYPCPGCRKEVDEFCIKNHISNCEKYLDYALHWGKIQNLTQKNDINQLKFLLQQINLAREHIESLISKKSGRVQEEDDFDFLDISQSSNNVIMAHKSDIYQQPLKLKGQKKNSFSFSFPQFEDKQEPVFQKILQQKSKKIQEIKKQPKVDMKMDLQLKMGMKMDRQHRMGMKIQEQPRMGIKQPSPKNKMRMQQQQDEIVQINNPEIVQCPLCRQKFYSSYNIDKLEYIQECWQLVCKKCLKQYIEDQFVASDGFPKCPHKGCDFKIPEHQSRAILGDRFEKMQDKVMRKINNFNIVQCLKCGSQYDFAPGNPNDAPKKDENGKAIRSQHAILFAEQRFVCPRPDCKTQQCKECNASPYHLGMDCKEFKSRALMLKCRYCITPITDKNIWRNAPPSLTDICNSEDCQLAAKDACTKILPCSHPCSGVKNEKKCLPCLREGCCENEPSLGGETGDSYCSICFTEGLGASPAIQCGCGHIFHFKCIKKRFQIKWLTPRILFKFCVCPLCNKWLQVPPENQLYKSIEEMKQLHSLIQKMSLERLKFQECQKDQKLVNKDSPYYNKPKQYAMAIYAYFMCFKCKKPYFGGRKNCAEVMNAGNDQKKQGYDEKQLVCPKCCDIPIENCPKHGVDFIEFKCKFCCSTAQWFCWGNTHFCEPCHKRQCNGDYVSKYDRDKLPKCEGPGKCPIGGNHGLNGEEKMLGCAICRNYKDNSKNF